jgi:arginyl-tRNA synthetase
MQKSLHAIEDACALFRHHIGDGGYGVAYGSHAAGTASDHSDLDLLFVTTTQLSESCITDLIDAVLALHHRHELAVDQEVSYENKIHATCADMVAAFTLQCFPLDMDGMLTATPTSPDRKFLNSSTFRARLLLNALTTPHVFLGGSVVLYQRHVERAERALATLAAAACRHRLNPSVCDLVEAVVTGPGGETGQDFLGYRPTAHLYSTLQRAISRSRAIGSPPDTRHGRTRNAGWAAQQTRLAGWDTHRDEGGVT